MLATEAERAQLSAEAQSSPLSGRGEGSSARLLRTLGTTELRGLAPGTYSWFGLEEGYAVVPAEIVVPAVERHQVEVVWRRVEVLPPSEGG